ncbi:MAG: CocE/NonD family hydrolase [Oceanipulchritudo sp.]
MNGALEKSMEAIEVRYGVSCRMPDGVRLAADIYTPPGEGPYPVLLMRQPYGRDIASTVVYAQPSWYCRRGFIVVIQDVRGRGDSEGVFNAFHNEAGDGRQTVEWAAQLEKANGCVGMYGFSYQASTQLLAASTRPPALKAIAPHMTAFDLYSGWFYRGGILQQQGTLGWGNQMLREDARRQEAWDLYERLEASFASPGSLLGQFPIREVSPLTDPGNAPYVREWLHHDQPDAYWEAFNMLHRTAELAEIPSFHLTGWYDFYTRGSMDGYRAMVSRVPARQKLVAGPWTHIPWGTRVAGRDLGEAARYPVDELLADWMRHWCRGDRPASAFPGPPVSYFSMGDLAWHEAGTWPPEGVVGRTFFLGSRGNANSIFGDGRLREEEPGEGTIADRFVYDPEVPVPGPGVQAGSYAWGPVDLYPGQQGNNLLVYRTEPFPGRRFFAGQPRCRLHVHSSAGHTAFVVRLSVRRGSRSEFLSLGAAQLYPENLTEDGSAELMIPLDDTAFSVGQGEALLLDVCSSAYPLLARHPNTSQPINAVPGPEAFARATQVVLHDAGHLSALYLEEVVDAA